MRGKLYANEGSGGGGQSIAVESSMLTKGVRVGGGESIAGGGRQSIAVESSMLTKGVRVRGGRQSIAVESSMLTKGVGGGGSLLL